jgi:putative ABC transport system permease protein
MRGSGAFHQTERMIRIALKDLQWRSRRVVIAILGAALVLAMALVMSGLSAGFDNESARTVALARATNWVVDAGGTGPFLQPSPLNATTVSAIVSLVGRNHAAPIIFSRQSVSTNTGAPFGTHEHVNLVGVEPYRIGSPKASDGKPLAGPGEVVVDSSLGAKIGSTIRLGTHTFRVVGKVRGARLLAGVPNVYIAFRDAQKMNFGGKDLATAVVTDQDLVAPPGTKSLSNSEAQIDGLRPVVNAKKTITMVRSLLWLVAALIVGSVMYLSALERSKDFAVLKGMGAKSSALGGSLAVQAAALGICASVIGGVIAMLIAPLFPISSEIPQSAYLLLPLLAVIVGLVASIGAAKRMFSIQPALAFGS